VVAGAEYQVHELQCHLPFRAVIVASSAFWSTVGTGAAPHPTSTRSDITRTMLRTSLLVDCCPMASLSRYLYTQYATPPWCEHAPLPVALLDVPSRHTAPIRMPLLPGTVA
jgi:hypothetical protein